MKVTLSTTYALIWQLNWSEHYKFTADGICINTRTNRRIKKVLCGGSVGYCINGKFVSATTLRPQLERIPKETPCPF